MNRRLLLFLILALIAGILMVQRRRVEPVATAGNRVIAVVTRPIEWVVVGIRDRARGVTRAVTDLFGVRADNAALREEVATLRRALREREEARLENERLRQLLELPTPPDMRELPAHVIGSNPTNWFRTLRIDRGERDGVRVDSAVIAEGGVVGHVVEITPRRATVLLLLDANSRVAAVLQDERAQGLIEGQHAAELRLTYVDRRTHLEPGLAVLTSGMGGVYPKGLLVGYITDVATQEQELFHIASVRPSVDFARLEHVVVLLPADEPAASDLADVAAS